MKLEVTVPGLTDVANELKALRVLYQRDLFARGIWANLEDSNEEGEIIVPYASERDKFVAEVDSTELEEAEKKEAHAEYLRELEAEALRLLTPSGFVPGVGPEGAEDPANSSEGAEYSGEGPPPRAEG